MSCKFFYILSLTIVCTLRCLGETALSDSIVNLDEVTVKASANHPSVTVQTLAGAELQGLSSTTIADALKYFAGVQIKDYGGLGGLKTVNVRSLGAQHVGVYIDGIRINNAQNGTVDLGKYSLSTLESISLYNANKLGVCQSPSEYASGSTVYMRTRRPTRDSMSVLGTVGSFQTYRGRLNVQFDRIGWSGFIDGEYLKSKGNYPFRYKSEYEDTVGRRHNSDITYTRIEGALFKSGFSSHIYLYISERGCPGGIVRRLSDKYNNVGREWDTDMFAQASWEHRFSRYCQFRLNTKYTYEYLRYNTDYPENQNTAKVDNHYWQNDGYISASLAYTPIEFITLNTGYDVRLSWLDADLKRFDIVRRLDCKAVVATNIRYREFQLAGSLLYQYYKDKTITHVGAADPLKRFTPSVALSYCADNLIFKGWYKSIFRAPTLNDLYYTQVGNRNLKPEYTTQWDLGVEYSLATHNMMFSVQADAYLNHITNRIVCLPLRGTYTWSMMNYGRTYCHGLNATISCRGDYNDFNCSLLTSFTLQRDLNHTDPKDKDTYNKPICYSPTFSCGITGIIGWRTLTLTVSELYVGKRMWSYADPDDILQPYNNVDVKLSAVYRRFAVSFEINDLFDIQYEHIPRYPMPGRQLKFSLCFSI